MSLFDRDFEFTKESNDSLNWDSEYLFEESKKCDDCDDEGADGEPEPEDTKAAENDAKKVDECALNFVVGCPAIESANEELYFLTLEGMAVQMAFERTDTACTEAWSTANSDEEREMVTENFKETVKKYWVRFKAFLGRIKNMIIRTAQRFVGYVKTLIARLSAKWATRKSNFDIDDENKKYLTDVDVTVHKALLTRKIGDLANAVMKAYSEEFAKLVKTSSNVTTDSAEPAKDFIGKVELKEKAKILEDIIGKAETCKVSELKLNIRYLHRELTAELPDTIKFIDLFKKDIMDAINKQEAEVKNMKDIDSAVMSVKMAAINKCVSIYNRRLSLMNQMLVLWINARTKCLNAVASHTRKSGDKKEATTASALFFDDMMSIIL